MKLWRKPKKIHRASVAGRSGWSVESWFYEQENGLAVLSETHDAANGYQCTTESLIPKAAILAYARKVALTNESEGT